MQLYDVDSSIFKYILSYTLEYIGKILCGGKMRFFLFDTALAN